MAWIILILIVVALISGPGIWVKAVMKKHHSPADRYPGSGSEFAIHLLEILGMEHVKVEKTPLGDHYDPGNKVVRLSEPNHDGRSLTAITVAAHEVGHAIQDYDGYLPLKLRTRLAAAASILATVGSAMIWITPLIMLAFRVPQIGLFSIIGGLVAVISSSIVHLITLPVEWDASFGRALPVMNKGGYLLNGDLPKAKSILRAAAMTYVSASLLSIAQVWRWLRLPR